MVHSYSPKEEQTDPSPIVGRTCADDVKKVLDARYWILVTRCEKRSKNFFDSAIFGVEVAVFLIEKLTTNEHEWTQIY